PRPSPPPARATRSPAVFLRGIFPGGRGKSAWLWGSWAGPGRPPPWAVWTACRKVSRKQRSSSRRSRSRSVAADAVWASANTETTRATTWADAAPSEFTPESLVLGLESRFVSLVVLCCRCGSAVQSAWECCAVAEGVPCCWCGNAVLSVRESRAVGEEVPSCRRGWPELLGLEARVRALEAHGLAPQPAVLSLQLHFPVRKCRLPSRWEYGR